MAIIRYEDPKWLGNVSSILGGQGFRQAWGNTWVSPGGQTYTFVHAGSDTPEFRAQNSQFEKNWQRKEAHRKERDAFAQTSQQANRNAAKLQEKGIFLGKNQLNQSTSRDWLANTGNATKAMAGNGLAAWMKDDYRPGNMTDRTIVPGGAQRVTPSGVSTDPFYSLPPMQQDLLKPGTEGYEGLRRTYGDSFFGDFFNRTGRRFDEKDFNIPFLSQLSNENLRWLPNDILRQMDLGRLGKFSNELLLERFPDLIKLMPQERQNTFASFIGG